jgi:hypothetical protein
MIVRVDPRLPEFLVGDVSRFRQIIANLLGNAVAQRDDIAGKGTREHRLTKHRC